MITEDYCSFEIAKLLKEKGLEGDITAYYHIWDNGTRVCSVQEFSHSEAPHLYIPAPTLQMAMKWLREVHNLFIQITIDFSDGAYPMYNSTAINLETCEKTIITGYDRYSYKEAITTALKYSLENLI